MSGKPRAPRKRASAKPSTPPAVSTPPVDEAPVGVARLEWIRHGDGSEHLYRDNLRVDPTVEPDFWHEQKALKDRP